MKTFFLEQFEIVFSYCKISKHYFFDCTRSYVNLLVIFKFPPHKLYLIFVPIENLRACCEFGVDNYVDLLKIFFNNRVNCNYCRTPNIGILCLHVYVAPSNYVMQSLGQ